MKRFLALVLVAAITLASLCACSNNAVNVSEKALAIAQSAIEATDDYLDSKVGYDEVSNKLTELENEMNYVYDKTDEERMKNNDFYVLSDITIIRSCITNDNFYNSDTSYKEIIEARNSLAEEAGLEKR